MTPEHLLMGITILLLSVFLGFELINKVPPTLHTPLMSGANAISGITILAALDTTSNMSSSMAAGIGFMALVLATVNVVGGFFVTGRMLNMFKR